MEYLYPKLLDGAHELQTMARAEWNKAYIESCKKAIIDIAIINAKREKLITKAEQLSIRLIELYDLDNREDVSDILEQISKNLKTY